MPADIHIHLTTLIPIKVAKEAFRLKIHMFNVTFFSHTVWLIYQYYSYA